MGKYHELLDNNDIEGALKYANNHNQEYKKYKELQFGKDELGKLEFLLDSSKTIEEKLEVAIELNTQNYYSKGHLGGYIELLKKVKKSLEKYQTLLGKNDIDGALSHANEHNKTYPKFAISQDELDKLGSLLDSSKLITYKFQVFVHTQYKELL